VKIRRALIAVPLALAAIATSSLAAAPKATPQIVDAKGDSAAGQASLDILSVLYATSGTGTGRAYLPKKLTVTLTLASAPDTRGVVNYNLKADTDGCGIINIHFAPGNAIGSLIGDSYARFGSCQDAGVYFPAKIKGSVVSFEFALKAIGVDRGTEFSAFTATVDAGEPATGIFGTQGGPAAGLGDKATGDGTWVIP